MLRNPLRSFDHKFFRTMIDRDDPEVIPDFYAANIENLILRDAGKLELRDGITARGASPGKTIIGATTLNTSSINKHIRVIDGAGNTAKFQHSTDGITWTDSTSGGSRTTGARWSFTQANGYIYGVNGNDTPIKHDGTTVSTVAAIPQGTAIEWWKNYAWVISSVIKDRVYFSNVNDPETWTTGTEFININLGDSSGATGLKGTAGSSGRLFIGKESSVYFITGSSASNFALNPLTFEHGIASHWSMIHVGNDVWCMDKEGHVRSLYRSQYDTPFSALTSSVLQNTVAGLNKGSLSKSSAVFYNNFAMFFVPNGVDSYNSLVLVFDMLANEGKGGWLKFTNWNIGFASIIQSGSQPKLFLHDSRTNNGQCYEWTGTADNGQAITGKWESKIYNFDLPMQEKRFFFSYQYADAQGNYLANWYSSIDRYYYTLLKQVSLAGTGNKLLGVDWTLGVDKLGSGGNVKDKIYFTDNGGQNHGTTVQVKLELISSTVKLSVNNFSMHYMPYGLR